jgi:hypothetical protein
MWLEGDAERITDDAARAKVLPCPDARIIGRFVVRRRQSCDHVRVRAAGVGHGTIAVPISGSDGSAPWLAVWIVIDP